MELRDGVVELAGNVGDGLCGIGLSENGFQDLANLAGGDAAKKSLEHQFVDGFLAALIAR